MRRHVMIRGGAALCAAVLVLAACNSSGGESTSPTTSAPAVTDPETGTTDAGTGGDGGAAAAPDDNSVVVPALANAMGPGFEGVYVGPDVRIETVSDDPVVRTLLAPFPCERLRMQLATSNWDVLDRLASSPQLDAAGVRDTLVLRRDDQLVWATLTGAADCEATVWLAPAVDLQLVLPAADESGRGWAITSRCVDRDGVRTVTVEMLTVSGAGASVDVAIDASGSAAIDGAVAGRSPIGWLSALSRGYTDPMNPPPGELYQLEGGSAEVTSTDRLSGSFVASGAAADMSGTSGTARFGAPFACASVEDVSLPIG